MPPKPTGNRPEAIVPVRKVDRYLKWLLYGDPGVGKTVLVGTAPNCLILKSASDNTDSAAIFGSKADVWEMGDWATMEEAYDFCKYSNHGYDFVSFDTCTLFQELGLDDIMADLVAQKPHRSIYLPDKGEYGQNMNRLSKWIRDMKLLPFHFIVTAHAFQWTEEDGTQRFWPAIHGKNMPSKIAGYMNLVTYMVADVNDEGKERRVLYCRKREEYFAKDGWNAFGERIINPTIPKMLNTLGDRLAPAKKVTGLAKKAGTTTKKSAPAKVAGTRKTTTGRKSA